MRKEIRTLFGQKIGVCISVYYTLMNIFSWFFGAFPVCLTEEKSTNYSVHSVTQNFDWSVCSTSSKKFVLCAVQIYQSKCKLLHFAFHWWEITFVANNKNHISSNKCKRFFNDRKFLWEILPKIFGTILLSHIFQDFFFQP